MFEFGRKLYLFCTKIHRKLGGILPASRERKLFFQVPDFEHAHVY